MIESTILGSLLGSESYFRKIKPFLKTSYFAERADKIIYELIDDYIGTYNSVPSKEVLLIQLDQRRNVSETDIKEVTNKVKALAFDSATDEQWLVDKTEAFCKDKAVFNAVKEAILILDGEDKKQDRGAIPQILSDALAVSFDTAIGHSYIEDFAERYDFYHTRENKIEFDIDIFNKITKGGVSRKSLCCILASCVHPDTKVRVRWRKS